MSGNKTVTKKGRCLNIGNCNKANSKEIIDVNIGEDFVCPECGGELVEVKTSLPVWIYIVGGMVVAALIALGIICARSCSSGGSGLPSEGSIDSLSKGLPSDGLRIDSLCEDTVIHIDDGDMSDSIPEAGEPETEIETETESGEGVEEETLETTDMGTLNLGYGTYVGKISGGKANGLGTLTYRKRHRISASDSQERYADPGDYVKGDFENNEVKTVRWYGSDNKLKGTIFAGSNGL